MSSTEIKSKVVENSVPATSTLNVPSTSPLKKESPKVVVYQSALHMITALSLNDGKNLSEKLESINMIAETALKSATCVK